MHTWRALAPPRWATASAASGGFAASRALGVLAAGAAPRSFRISTPWSHEHVDNDLLSLVETMIFWDLLSFGLGNKGFQNLLPLIWIFLS